MVLRASYKSLDGMGLNILTDDELDAIHCATLDVLQNSGIKVPSKEAQEIFDGGGCEVDRKNDKVKIPPYLVEDAVRSAPGTVIMAGKTPEKDYLCGTGISFTNFSEGVEIIDLFTRERRETTKMDVGDIARVCDALDQDICVKAVGANNVPPEVKIVHMAEAMFTNTSKHCLIGGGDVYNVRKSIEMAAACVGGLDKLRERPIYTASFCASSPLTLNSHFTEPIIELARAGVPVKLMSMVLSGATGPVTIAGTLVVHNAEILSAVVLSQLVRKGAPVIYGSATTIMDLIYSTAVVGSPEMGIFSAAIAKIAKYYEIPSFVAGGFTDSKIPDAQAAHEATLTGFIAALAGANLIFGLGALGQGITFDYAKLIIDNELTGMIKRAVAGLSVTEKTLAVDVIKQVGAGGEFLSHEHTYRLFRSEHAQSKLFDRKRWEEWMSEGGKDLSERAYAKAEQIFNDHKPVPLLEGAAAAMRSIVNEAEEHYGLELSTE